MSRERDYLSTFFDYPLLNEGTNPPMGFAKPVTIAFGRTATMLLIAAVAIVLVLSSGLVWRAARVQNERAAEQTRHFANILLTNRLKFMSQTVVDYGDWGDAYRNLHLKLDLRWAWDQNNMGHTLKDDLGIEALAVFDGADREVYSLADGMRSDHPTFAFERDRVNEVVHAARAARSKSGEAVQAIISLDGSPMFVAAAAIGPGGDETVQPDDLTTSVLVFGDWLSPSELEEMRLQLGLERLRFEVVDPTARPSGDIVLASAQSDRAVAMIADYPEPGTAMLWSLLPWVLGLVVSVGGFVIVLAHQGMRSAREGKDLAQALRAAKRHAEHQAFHDMLTSLPNRASFQNAIWRALDSNTGDLALLYLDLDHFKAVNDRFGHAAGDHVLREVARRLVQALPAGDLCARIGGDEFVILAASSNRYELGLRARRIIRSLSEPIPHGDEVFRVGVTIGVALAIDGDDPETLMKSADVALYQAKEAGRGRFRFAERAPAVLDSVVA
jgi:diguanylate cyclase (GGDEF)-like protein